MTYPANASRVHGLAIAAMILGILGIPSAGLLGIIGLILGIVSLTTINRSRGILTGKGMAITGIVTGAISLVFLPFLLLALILMPSLGKARELAQRSTCAANLGGITKSINVYAADENGQYPVVARNGTDAAATAFGTGDPNTDPDKAIKSMYASPTPSVSQNMWLLVLKGQVAAKQYICKSDPTPTTPAMVTTITGDYYPNFNNGAPAPANSLNSLSYGIAFPWITTGTSTIGGWWRDATDAALPLVADMGPANGTGSPPANVTATSSDPRAANSFIHQRDGQNVGYGDAHVEFQRRADVGHSNDNIYTSGTTPGKPSATGTPGINTGPGGPSDYDVILVPFMNGNTHARQVN